MASGGHIALPMDSTAHNNCAPDIAGRVKGRHVLKLRVEGTQSRTSLRLRHSPSQKPAQPADEARTVLPHASRRLLLRHGRQVWAAKAPAQRLFTRSLRAARAEGDQVPCGARKSLLFLPHLSSGMLGQPRYAVRASPFWSATGERRAVTVASDRSQRLLVGKAP